MKIGLQLVAFTSLLLFASVAGAEKRHQVSRGQNLASIASKYHVKVGELAAANGMTRNSPLRKGQVLIVPARGEVYVAPGNTLASIAKKYNISAKELAEQNRIKLEANLKPGQRLLLPGFEEAEEQEQAAIRWGEPKHPGVVTLYRVWSRQQAKIRLANANGRIRSGAVQRLEYLLRSKNTKKGKPPDRRLVRLISQVSDHFGGRIIRVISGYREATGYTKLSSRHVSGEAIDFRIDGVPEKAIVDYCRKFENAGVGYYPNSHFVHLDVRDENTFWTDVSRSGEPPSIAHPSDAVKGKAGSESPSEENSNDETTPSISGEQTDESNK
jgi:uncharacterized protein YcbK (DUF882 family)